MASDLEQYRDIDVLKVSDLIKRFPKYFTISIASKRNSGKTVLVSQIIQELLKSKKVDVCLVMSNSAGLNDDYNFLPDGLVQPFNEEILEKVWLRQQKAPKEKREHIMVVLDDVLSDKAAIQSESVQRIFAQGRHNHISCIVLSQVSNHILSPIVKANSDFILWSRLNRQQLGTLWESMNGIPKDKFLLWAEFFGGHHFNFCVFDNFTDATVPAEFLTVVRATKPRK